MKVIPKYSIATEINEAIRQQGGTQMVDKILLTQEEYDKLLLEYNATCLTHFYGVKIEISPSLLTE